MRAKATVQQCRIRAANTVATASTRVRGYNYSHNVPLYNNATVQQCLVRFANTMTAWLRHYNLEPRRCGPRLQCSATHLSCWMML